MKKISLLAAIIFLIILPQKSLALYKPYLKIEADRQTYQQKVATYQPADQKKLTDLNNQIDQINKQDTDLLNQQIDAQAAILDEYQRRHPDENEPKLKNARYWLTYAHEAVAFQLIQVYIYNLSSEKNIKSDATATVDKFESDLSATRTKVINSLNIIKVLVKDE